MAGVPFIFGNATTSIPLSNLDANFNTGVTIGNTTVGLGNTVTTLGNVTLTNTIAFGALNGTLGATTPNTISATTIGGSSTIGVGGATPSASGAGITFPATQSASSDANTLDDYEEGTWTPTLSCDSGSVSGYNIQNGYYRKIGSQVTLWFAVRATSISGSLLRIAGLPFSVNMSGTNPIPMTMDNAPIITLEVYTGTNNQAFFNSTGGYLTGASAQGKSVGGVYTYIAT